MTTHTRTGLQNVDTGVHVTNLNDFIHIHIIVTAYARELVSESDVYGTIGILYHLGHLSSADVGNDNLALAEGGVEGLDALAHLAAVGADRAVVVQDPVQLGENISVSEASGKARHRG